MMLDHTQNLLHHKSYSTGRRVSALYPRPEPPRLPVSPKGEQVCVLNTVSVVRESREQAGNTAARDALGAGGQNAAALEKHP